MVFFVVILWASMWLFITLTGDMIETKWIGHLWTRNWNNWGSLFYLIPPAQVSVEVGRTNHSSVVGHVISFTALTALHQVIKVWELRSGVPSWARALVSRVGNPLSWETKSLNVNSTKETDFNKIYHTWSDLCHYSMGERQHTVCGGSATRGKQSYATVQCNNVTM